MKKTAGIERTHSDSRRPHYAILILVGLTATFPLIAFGIPFISDDGAWHYIYYQQFSDQLWSGDYYPRWLQGLNAGLGSPTFFYYPPLVYYITSIFKPLPISVWHQLGLTMSLSIVLSGLFAYRWLESVLDARSALIASLVYMVLPYHLAADAYARAALAEAFNFVWMPLALFYTVRLSRGGRLAFFGLTFAMAAMFLTHAITAMIFIPVPICYAVFISRPGLRFRSAFLSIAGISAALALASIYMLPALTTQHLVNMSEMREGLFSFRNWLIPFNADAFAVHRRELLIALQALAIAGFAYATILLRRKRDESAAGHFWFALCVMSVVMMFRASEPLWNAIRPLQYLQFPVRFNILLCIAAAALVGITVHGLRGPLSRSAKIFAFVLCVFGLIWTADILIRTNKYYFSPFRDSFRVEQRQRALDLNADWYAFWPKTVPTGAGNKLEDLLYALERSGRHGSLAWLTGGTGTIVVDDWKPRKISIRSSGSEAAVVELHRFYFPGWTAWSVEENKEIKVRPSEANGLISIELPKGTSEVRLQLNRLRSEIFGEVISAITLLILLSLFSISIIRPIRILQVRGSDGPGHGIESGHSAASPI